MKHPLTEEELLHQLHTLPREMSPSNDGWDGIARRIASVPGGIPAKKVWAQPGYMAIAAGVLLALGASLLVNLQRPGGRSIAPDEVTRLQDVQLKEDLYQVGPGVISELEYRAAFQEFLALDSVPVRTQTQEAEPLDFGWEATRQAEMALVEALRKEPNSVFLKERLSALRARQLELLQTIAALEMAARRNTI
jgi:hypothetical protein